MFWLIVAVMVLVVGAAALVALGGGGSLPEAERDRLAARLPLDRPLGRADVDALRFPMALRGYRMDEVDDVLDRLGAELTHRDVRVAELEAALGAALATGHPQAGEPGTAEFEALRMRFATPGARSAESGAGLGAEPGAGSESVSGTTPQPPQDTLPGVDVDADTTP
ncbi:DivIVA domain-containing protein [Streptacidiphilus sp. MAP12-16]|uniref:DivIVA domain-containing protein n=1 Tax=Streptacidiphilus sp. MAP12-16 TaxID=3156300 RepID=UPI003514486B